MKWSWNIGKIAGIQLSMHWTFLILLAWIFFIYYSLEGSVQQALMGVLFILTLFVCVLLHELGHSMAARRYGIGTKVITILPIGGLAQLERMPEEPRHELWVAAAGPLVNVVIAVLIYLYLRISGNWPDASMLEMQTPGFATLGFWFYLLMANVILVVFNLIPAFPMDGGRMLRALLAFRMPRTRATQIAASIGQFLAITFVFLGFFVNFWLVFIGIFIYLGAGAESRFETTKSALDGLRVRDVLMTSYRTVRSTDTLGHVVDLLLDGTQTEFLVVDSGEVRGIVTRTDLVRGLSQLGKDGLVSEVTQKDFISLDKDQSLIGVYNILMSGPARIAPVLDHGELVGMVDKENIDEIILVNRALEQAETAHF